MPGAPEYIEGEAEAVNDVFQNIQSAVNNATEALGEMTENTKAYAEDLTLKKALEDAKAALNDLLEKAKLMKDDAAEIPMKALSKAIVVANSAIEKLKKLVKEFDEKHKVSKNISAGVNTTLDKVSVSIAEVSHYTTEAASNTHEHLRGVNDAIKQSVSSTANRGLNFLLNTFAEIDVKYDVRSKAKENIAKLDETLGIQDKAKSLDKKFDISEHAKDTSEMLAEKTKGPILSSYEKGLKFAQDGLDYISEEFEKARQAKKAEVKASEVKSKAQDAAGEVKDAAKEKVDEAKSKMESKGKEAKEKAKEAKSDLTSAAENAKDNATKKANEAKGKAKEAKSDLASAAEDAKDNATKKANEAKSKLASKAESAADKAKDAASKARK